MFKRLLSDCEVERRYLRAGRISGAVVSLIYLGEPVGFEEMLREWEKWEAEYARRGYRTISLDGFIEAGGYGRPLLNIGIKRDQAEEPILHDRIYREDYLHKIRPVINPFAGEIQTGTYAQPSTEGKKNRKTAKRKPKARKH